MTITFGTLGDSDASAWAQLLAAVEAVDATGENYSAEDLAEELEDPMVDFNRGTLAIRLGDQLIGYGLLRSRPVADPTHAVYFEGAVHPDHRRTGLGRRIVRWAIEAAPAVHLARHPDKPLELLANVGERNVWAQHLLTDEAFTATRWFFTMERFLTGPVEDLKSLDGVRIVPFDFAHDIATLKVRNEAFADHWGSTPQTEQTWKQWFTGSRSFRADLSFLAFAQDTEEVVGILLASHYEADTEVTGIREAYITTIGTRRAWRKRGIAGALIDAALVEAKRQGFHRAGLDVDADSPTGALGLYESHGFAVAKKHTSYLRPIDL